MQKLVSKPTTSFTRSTPERRFSVLRSIPASHTETTPICPTRPSPRIYRHREQASREQLERQAEDIVRHLDAIECNISAEPSPSKVSVTEPSWNYTIRKRTGAKDSTPSKHSHAQRLYRVRHSKSADELFNADAPVDRANFRRVHRSRTYLGHRDYEEKNNHIDRKPRQRSSTNEQSTNHVSAGRAGDGSNIESQFHNTYDHYNVESREDPVTRKHVIRIRFQDNNENTGAALDYRRPISKNIVEKEKIKTFISESRYRLSHPREKNDSYDHSQNSSNETREKLDRVSERSIRSRFRSASPVHSTSRSGNWPYSRVREYSRSPSPPPAPVLPTGRSLNSHSNQERRRTASCVNIIRDQSSRADNGKDNSSRLKMSHSLDAHPTRQDDSPCFGPSKRLSQDQNEHRFQNRTFDFREDRKCPERSIEKTVYKPKESVVKYITISHTKDTDSGYSIPKRSITRTLSNNRISNKDPSCFDGYKSSNNLSNKSFSSLKNLPNSEDVIRHRYTTTIQSQENSSKRPHICLSKRTSEPLDYTTRSSSNDNKYRVPTLLSRSFSQDNQVTSSDRSRLLDQRDGPHTTFSNHDNYNGNGSIYRSGCSSSSDTSEVCCGAIDDWSSQTLPTRIRSGNHGRAKSGHALDKSKVHRSPHCFQSEEMNRKSSKLKAAADEHKLFVEDRSKWLTANCDYAPLPDRPGQRSVGVQYNGYSPTIPRHNASTSNSKPSNSSSNTPHHGIKVNDSTRNQFPSNKILVSSIDKNQKGSHLLESVDSNNGHYEISHGRIHPVNQSDLVQRRRKMKNRNKHEFGEKENRSLLRPSHTFIVRSDSERSSTSEMSDSPDITTRSGWPAPSSCYTSGQIQRTRQFSHGSSAKPANGRFGAASYTSSFVSNVSSTSNQSRSPSPALRKRPQPHLRPPSEDKTGQSFVQRFMEREPPQVSERKDGVRELSNDDRFQSMEYSRHKEEPSWSENVQTAIPYTHSKKDFKERIDSSKCTNCKLDKQKSPKSTSWKISRVLKYFSPSVRNKKQVYTGQDLSAKSAYNISKNTEFNVPDSYKVYMAYNTPPNHDDADAGEGHPQARKTLQKRHDEARSVAQRSNSHVTGSRPHPALHRTDRPPAAGTSGFSPGTNRGHDSRDEVVPAPNRRSVYLHATTVADIPCESTMSMAAPPPAARRVRRSFSLLGLWGGAKSANKSGTTYRALPVRATAGARPAALSTLPGGPRSHCDTGASCAACRHGHFENCLARCRPLLIKTNSA